MNIVVGLKQILDPEIPARDFSIDPARHEAVRGSANLVMNIFCGNALETALQFRDQHGGTVAALSFGPNSAEDVLRKWSVPRVDDAILITREDDRQPDPLVVVRVLAAGVRKRPDVDIVLVGRESGDWGHGQTGGLLAEELGWPCISFVDQIEPSPDGPRQVRVRRQTDDGWELLDASLPVVLTITNHERNVPRIPKTRDVMQSFRKPLARSTPAELGLALESLAPGRYLEVVDLSVPAKETACEFVTGDSLEERVARFAERVLNVVRSA